MNQAPIPLIRTIRPVAAFVVALAAGVIGPGSTRASTFDLTTGRITLEYTDYAVNFDWFSEIPAELNPVFYDANWNAIADEDAEALFELDRHGLEGAGALVMGGSVIALELSLSELAQQFSGRQVEFLFWQRPEGTRFAATLVWVITDANDPSRSINLSTLRFQPTGRATDDGWEEWTSGPVDFSAAGVLPPAVIQFVDYQHNRWSWVATTDDTLRGRLDALEIVDRGPAAVPDATCNSLNAGTACTARGVCMAGRCVDSALFLGQAPLDPVLREDYLDRILFQFRTFEGGRMPQSLMPILEAAVDSIRDDTNPARFWAGLRNGISALRDGHASPPMMTYGLAYAATNLGICVHLGEADLLPQGGQAPLVFEVAGSNPVADQLQVGDVLTAIDGLPPYEWAAQMKLNTTHSGDPLAFDVIAAPRFPVYAGVFGATLTFERCPHTGPNPTTCDATEVQTIDIDLAQTVGAPIWSGSVPEWLDDDLHCDYRFRRDVIAADVRENHFIGYADDGPIRTVLINAVPSPWGDAGDWWDIATEALDPPPTYLILDQRLGSGGAITTVDYLMGLLVTEADFDRMEILPIFERRLDADLWTMLRECISGWNEVCANYMPWVLHDYTNMPGNLRGVAGSVPMAVLNGADVSGNDYTSKLATYRAAPTRFFGAGSTYGAFGPIVSLPGHLDESSGGSMQLWDTIFVKEPDDPLITFATGVGIVPDDRVLQRQSDALQGIDTTIEAAKAWLLQR